MVRLAVLGASIVTQRGGRRATTASLRDTPTVCWGIERVEGTARPEARREALREPTEFGWDSRRVRIEERLGIEPAAAKRHNHLNGSQGACRPGARDVGALKRVARWG